MGKGDGKGKAAAGFDEQTLEVYKECFKLMDIDKDGVINKNDLRAAFDNVGRLVMDDELNQMLQEVGGPCTYDNMIKMFEAKMSGGVNDPDELVVAAFKAFDEEVEEKVKGQMITKHILDTENFQHVLQAFSDKMTDDEIEDIFGEFEFDDDGQIYTKSVVDLFVSGAMDEKKEEEEEKKAGSRRASQCAPAADEGVKKKKKKKKAAK
jgi:Ca2+-binding EF-hand superfamily protein